MGNLLNKGTVFGYTVALDGGSALYELTATQSDIFGTTTGGQASGKKAIIDPPTGGAGQFKGLAITTPATLYNMVICKSA